MANKARKYPTMDRRFITSTLDGAVEAAAMGSPVAAAGMAIALRSSSHALRS